MSRYEFKLSQELAARKHPFNALIMAAMWPNTVNSVALRKIFPNLWDEMGKRFRTKDGYLPGDET